MIDLDMVAKLSLDLSNAPLDVITMVLSRMSLNDRFTCALVCKGWAEAAATRSIILEHTVQDLSCLQCWLEKHGDQVEVLQLHQCGNAALTALPCPQLQDLLLYHTPYGSLTIGSRVWSDIAAATKLTSVSLTRIYTAAGQADVVSAIAALPDLQQLTWRNVQCSGDQWLSDSLLLKQATQLTAVNFDSVSAEALEHLGLLTKLQDLDIAAAEEWDVAGCPGLQELKALTRLHLPSSCVLDLPANISQLTALQQLHVWRATALNGLQALTGLTQLIVDLLPDLSSESPPLQLTGLKHLELRGRSSRMPMSYLQRCTQLHVLEVVSFSFTGPGSLVASTSLEYLRLFDCVFTAADGAADRVTWQQVFSGPGQLPHLTFLWLSCVQPALQQADMECVVATCNNLRVVHLDNIHSSFAPPMAQLSALTSLRLTSVNNEQCGVLTQLSGLRELRTNSSDVSCTGLQQLAALEQLTSLGFGNLHPCLTMVRPDWLKEHLSDRLPGCKYAIINKAPAGHPSDVSTRLRQACNC